MDVCSCVQNLAGDVDEDKLRQMFAPFGAIQSCHIAREERDKKSVSRGFGFVCFISPEDAAKVRVRPQQLSSLFSSVVLSNNSLVS